MAGSRFLGGGAAQEGARFFWGGGGSRGGLGGCWGGGCGVGGGAGRRPAKARQILNGGVIPDQLADLLAALRSATEWPGQIALVRKWYEPHLERLYEGVGTRVADLETLENLEHLHDSRQAFLSDLTLDPPEATGDLAGDPLLDEDFLILSTIHSAKGQEWDVVYILNVVDGCIPSDMATGSAEEIEEERRLLYVAMT